MGWRHIFGYSSKWEQMLVGTVGDVDRYLWVQLEMGTAHAGMVGNGSKYLSPCSSLPTPSINDLTSEANISCNI